jgi:hypothetical protein
MGTGAKGGVVDSLASEAVGRSRSIPQHRSIVIFPLRVSQLFGLEAVGYGVPFASEAKHIHIPVSSFVS